MAGAAVTTTPEAEEPVVFGEYFAPQVEINSMPEERESSSSSSSSSSGDDGEEREWAGPAAGLPTLRQPRGRKGFMAGPAAGEPTLRRPRGRKGFMPDQRTLRGSNFALALSENFRLQGGQALYLRVRWAGKGAVFGAVRSDVLQQGLLPASAGSGMDFTWWRSTYGFEISHTGDSRANPEKMDQGKDTVMVLDYSRSEGERASGSGTSSEDFPGLPGKEAALGKEKEGTGVLQVFEIPQATPEDPQVWALGNLGSKEQQHTVTDRLPFPCELYIAVYKAQVSIVGEPFVTGGAMVKSASKR